MPSQSETWLSAAEKAPPPPTATSSAITTAALSPWSEKTLCASRARVFRSATLASSTRVRRCLPRGEELTMARKRRNQRRDVLGRVVTVSRDAQVSVPRGGDDTL